MNRMVYAVVALLVVGACVLPTNLIPITTAQPTIDSLGLTQSALLTIPTETATLAAGTPVTETPSGPTESPLPSLTEMATDTPFPDLTMTVVTATEFTISPEAAATATMALAGLGTISPTPGVLTWGTLPPEVPFSQIHLSNRSRTQAYISLQVTTQQGGLTIIEYPVQRFVKFKAPIGYYLYVAWVGGNKMVGNFTLRRNEDISITLYRDRVVIN